MRQGEVIADRFEIEQLVGSIGLAGVYRAHDRASGEVVAAKVFHHGEAYGVARVMREGEALAKLRAELHHPGADREEDLVAAENVAGR